MNFFAHTCIAVSRSEHPRFLLGAMLPDLTGMMGVRIGQIRDPELRAGVAHHHEADAAFHSAKVFTDLCADGIADLCGAGVERGTARAVAHVGAELVLDGVLCSDAEACRRYRAVLSHAGSAPLSTWLSLRGDEPPDELQAGIARLAAAPVPEGYRSDEFVAARLRHVLQRRPRLAMHAGDEPHVLAWLQKARTVLHESHGTLLAQVQTGLQTSS